MERVVVSGVGIVSAIGIGLSQNWESLKAGKPGIALPSILNTEHPDFVLGEVKLSTDQLIEKAGLPKGRKYSRTIAIGAVAVQEALKQASCTPEDLNQARFINATSVAGMDQTELAYARGLSESNSNHEAYLHHECGDSTETIANHFAINGARATISTACSSSANAIMQGAKMIKNGLADMVVVGGTDALSLFTLNGFRSLQILDKAWCRPFDKTRTGLNLGEAAAFMVLESSASLKKRTGKALAIVSGYGNANDAFHQTASSPDGNGAKSAMEAALNIANLSPSDIDYVNAHGTGTDINDSSEGNALKRIFSEDIPAYSSTKSFTGHTLAAAGAIEGVFSILALQNQCMFPNLNCASPIDEIKAPLTELESGEVNHVLSNSFGFGGNCSALIFSKP